jgi:hypothetical protein
MKNPLKIGSLAIAEMQEFANFSPQAQRYIRRSIDVALNRNDVLRFWPRNAAEEAAILAQIKTYNRLQDIRQIIPISPDVSASEILLAPLISISIFDIGQAALPTFSSYRFLYERLLGAAIRPWLPSAFCAAAASPHIQSGKRKELLQSISEIAATAPAWSDREPTFYPEWVEKIE